MQKLILRPFESTDHDRWYPLWRAYQDFYKADIPEAVSRITWHRLLDPAEPVDGTFATIDDELIGFVHFIEHRSCWTAGNYMYLQDLFVAPTQRGKGVGRLLIEHVYQRAAERGCARVHWLTHESNRDAMFLYDQIAERSGFLQYRKLLGG